MTQVLSLEVIKTLVFSVFQKFTPAKPNTIDAQHTVSFLIRSGDTNGVSSFLLENASFFFWSDIYVGNKDNALVRFDSIDFSAVIISAQVS